MQCAGEMAYPLSPEGKAEECRKDKLNESLWLPVG